MLNLMTLPPPPSCGIAPLKRLTALAAALVALMLPLAAVIAQDRHTTPIPSLMADAHPTPWGGRASYRILLANKGADRVTGGALSITYEIACTLTSDPDGPTCPSVPTLRRKTTMPCGEDEAGLIFAVNVGTAPYAGLTAPYTLTLTIRAIDFLAWSDATIDRINAQYPQRYQYNSATRRYDRVEGPTCPKTNHIPTRVTDPGGMNSTATVTVMR